MVAGSRSDERAWIRGAQSGSVPDLEALFKHHWPRAYRAAYLVVHDSGHRRGHGAGEALLAVQARPLDRRRPFGPWLHRIVVNRAIDWSRSRALRRESGDAALALVAAAAPAERDDTEPLAAALADTSPEHRGVIVMRHLLDYTPGEIAEALGLPRGTVNSRLRRGLDELAGKLDEDLK